MAFSLFLKPFPNRVEALDAMRNLTPALLALLLCTCQSAVTNTSIAPPVARTDELPVTDMPIARAPFADVQANWKQRLDQPYVYIEARGDYRQLGRVLEHVFAAAAEQDIEISGPPFALYYDDPGKVAVAELRLRACVPVSVKLEPRAPLAFDVLESTTVVYAYVGGPYPEVPRAYGGVLAYLAKLNWVESGPIREVYLSDPASVTSWDQLVTEVQVPAARRP